jgi:hypothetical protein
MGRAHWDVLLEGIDQAERRAGHECHDEQLWTFALACSYAAVEAGPSRLALLLTGCSVPSESMWFEVLPRSPRRSEGQSTLDLALGHIALRAGTESGIELQEGPGRREIVFCEFKWYSDIAYAVSYAQHRNQLARVIENALLFRSGTGDFADHAHVCLVTPEVFRSREGASRLYRYKWEEYIRPGREALIIDLRDCGLEPEPELPHVTERLGALTLAWKSYEELAFVAPRSPIRDSLAAFYETCKGAALSKWEQR